MKKLIFIISLLFITSNSYAKYQLYECKNSSDAMSCSGTCKKVKGFTIDLKIDKEKNVIIKTTYWTDKALGFNNKIVSTDSLNNCKVIDNSNWICNDEIKNELRDRIVILTETEGTTNGNYYRYSDIKSITLSNTKGEFLNGQCSPKSLLNTFN